MVYNITYNFVKKKKILEIFLENSNSRVKDSII